MLSIFSINICDWFALSCGLKNKQEWEMWAKTSGNVHDEEAEYPATPQIPMLQSRRMSLSSKLACEVFLTLIKENEVDGAIFVSQHGELERSYRVIENIMTGSDVSPTDFSLSVHNTAAGLATILAKKSIEISSLSGGSDGFHAGLFEAETFFQQGHSRILLLNFEGNIPDFYLKDFGVDNLPAFAVGFILEKGNSLQGKKESGVNQSLSQQQIPQALAFLSGILKQDSQFRVSGAGNSWLWTKK